MNQCSIIARYNICPLRFPQIALHHLPLPGLHSLNFISPISQIPLAATASVPEVNCPRPLLARGAHTHTHTGRIITHSVPPGVTHIYDPGGERKHFELKDVIKTLYSHQS